LRDVLEAECGKPVIMVGLGSPYLMEGFPEATTWLSAFSFQDIAQRAAARALLGDIGVSGKLPVTLPGAAPHALHVGDGRTTAAIPLTLQPASAELEGRLKPVYELLERAARDSPSLSGALEIAFRGQRVTHSFGRSPVSPRPVSHTENDSQESHAFSAYSAQPVLVTGLARLVQLKQLTLDTPISRALQGENISSSHADWRSISLSQWLQGGALEELLWIPPYLATSRGPDPTASFAPSASQSQHLREGGVEALILRRLTGLDEVMAIRELIYTPLGLTYYPDLLSARGEFDQEARLRCEELSIIGQLWLNGGIYAHKRLVNRKVLEQFLVPTNRGNEILTPGWKLAPAPGRSFTPKAFGWSSPGGMSLWVDPGRDICIAYSPGWHGLGAQIATTQEAAMRLLFAQVHDTIFKSLGLTE
jgi:CubicO group peptidase (beta-lactamase class C family)